MELWLMLTIAIPVYVVLWAVSVPSFTRSMLELRFNERNYDYVRGWTEQTSPLDSQDKIWALTQGVTCAAFWPVGWPLRGLYRLYDRGIAWEWLKAPTEIELDNEAKVKQAEKIIREFASKQDKELTTGEEHIERDGFLGYYTKENEK